MSNIRNQPCSCGSGKKYKKCCLLKGTATVKSKIVLSSTLESQLDHDCWYHGTDQRFDTWTIPPPPKPNEGLLVPHTSIFFTTDYKYADAAGKHLASVSLSSKTRILDTTANYDASEALRLELLKHEIASKTYNVNHDFWHEGWKTGNVLRMAYNDPRIESHMEKMIHDLAQQTGLDTETTSIIIQHNSSRGLIELICVFAKQLGFDAIFGHEVDRHSYNNHVIAQPWLAVMSKGYVSKPTWIK